MSTFSTNRNIIIIITDLIIITELENTFYDIKEKNYYFEK